MKLIEALEIANAAQEGPAFRVLLACGFTPLHLATAVKAHLRLNLAARSIELRTGLYGDVAGTLEAAEQGLDAALVVLEWVDLDPRLGWRSLGKVDETVVSDARMRLSRIESAIASLAGRIPVALSLPTLPLPPVFSTSGNELNRIEAELWQMLFGLAGSTRAAVLHPEGHGQGHDLRTELLNGFPYSFPAADAMASRLVPMVLPFTPKKGLITDLDETLWSGVLGDDGPEGISWDLDHKTQFHALYQQLLNVLAEAGVLVGVASKNDANLMSTALTRSDLVISPKHMFPIEVNWRPKTESIERILQAWNVGADSLVFVDDNRLELEQVSTAFPEIECVEFRMNDPRFLLELRDRFAKRNVREEDTLRVSSLRSGQLVRHAAADGGLETLLAGAKAKVKFRWGKDPADPRSLELLNKTNQFNLNGIRYTEADWNAYLSDPKVQLAVVEYEDRFGKLGKISVLAGREQSGGFEVDVWAMSCRAFSRRIEHQILNVLFSRWDSIRFRHKSTERNGPMQNFLSEMAISCQPIERNEFSRRCPTLFQQTECIHV
jgi:FkbH-like protein